MAESRRAGSQPGQAGAATGSLPRVGEGIGPPADAGETGLPKRAKTTPKPKPGTLTVQGGRRELKGYTVTEDELISLGLVQGGTSVAFALAGACFGFWLSVQQGVELAGIDAPTTAIAKWEAFGVVAFWCSVGLAAVGLGFLMFSGWRVRKIKRKTIHD